MIFADLGPLAVEVDGLPNPVNGRRLASVLALLLGRVDEVVSPAALIDAVWGETAPARASQSLESLVWRLRKLLEPQRSARQTPSVLRTEEHGYRLAVPPATVASRMFIAAAERLPVLLAERHYEQALDVASSALELWRGEPYEGVPEADWIGPVRERLVALHVDLGEYRVQALLETGQPERAVSELVPLLAAHPFRERLWAQRMLGLYRSGRQAAALDAFTQVRRLLGDELGVEPGPELRALQQELLDQAPGLDQVRPSPSASPGRVQLPSRRATIIGREDDLAAIVGVLGGAGLVTLTGPGGTGKTRLAIEAGFTARGDFPGGVWFVDLSQIVDPAGVPALTANTLGLGPQPNSSTEQVLLDYLAPRRLLLVLDNCEHVLSGARGLTDRILDHCPAVTVLATSREPLDLAGETRWPVTPLPVSDPGAPIAGAGTKGGTVDAAVALFVERLSNLRPDLDLDGPDGVHIRQICAAVGGLPLGIELAAARARVFELDEIAATLAAAPGQLTRSGSGPQRQASLLDAVDWSYRLARPDERILHRRLGCIGGPVTLEGAAALCGVAPLRPEQAMELLGGLVHRSLVTSTRSTRSTGSTRSQRRGRPTTFAQLVPIRAHAAAALAETSERQAVERARDNWVIDHVAAAAHDGRPGLADFYDWLDDNESAVRATLRSTLLTDPRPMGLTLLTALGTYWFDRSRLIEGGQWALAAKDLPNKVDLDEFDAAIAGLMHGWMVALNHEPAAAEPYLTAAVTALRTPPEGRLAEAAELLVLTAAVAWVGDMWSLAADVASMALDIGRAADRPHVVLRAESLLAACELIVGDPAAGLAAADQVLDANRLLDNSYAALFAYITKSLASRFTGDPLGGLRFSDEILRLQRDMGVHNVGNTLEVRGTLYLGLGQPLEAVRCFAASSAQNQREGRAWPWHPGTDELLEQLRAGLDVTEFERNWASGERLGLGDPGQLIAEWI